MRVQRQIVGERCGARGCAQGRALGQAGFTLTEVLVATAIGLVGLAAFTSFSVDHMYTMSNQANQTDLQTAARSIADLFAREVRRAGTGTNPTCSGNASTGLMVAKTTQVRFRADLDANGALTGANEDVTYYLNTGDSKSVTRRDNNASRTDTLWSGVSLTGSQFFYFDGNGNQLVPDDGGLSNNQLLQVRRIRLKLALTAQTIDPGDKLLLTAKEVADVELRNRYFVMAASCALN